MSGASLAGYRARRRLPAYTAPGGPARAGRAAPGALRTAALDGLWFTVEPGQIFGFLGPNRAGKTTVMRIVMGIEPPDEGTVRRGGTPVTHADRLAFGYMPEQPGLDPKMRVRDHPVYLARLHGPSTGQAAPAGDRWLRRPGIAANSLQRVEALSHGNQQRAQFAAAIGLIVAWFVLGYAFYCCAFAAAGAASSRQAEAPAKAGPLTPCGPAGLSGVPRHPAGSRRSSSPDHALRPAARPMATPTRMLLGHAAPWELPASAAVTLAAAYGLVRLAGRAYFGTILRFGRRATVREALRP